jgi:hypothetical protein
MRKLSLIIGAAVLVAACAYGRETLDVVDVVLTSGTTGTSTVNIASGYLEDIQVSVSDGVSTGNVKIAVLRPDAVVSAVEIATNNAVVGSALFRPVVDGTDITGAALTSDPPRRMYLLGEKLRMIVSGSPTNVTWKARAKLITQ